MTSGLNFIFLQQTMGDGKAGTVGESEEATTGKDGIGESEEEQATTVKDGIGESKKEPLTVEEEPTTKLRGQSATVEPNVSK